MVTLFVYKEGAFLSGQSSMGSGSNSLNFTHFHFPFTFEASKLTVSLTLAWGGSFFRGTSTWPCFVAMMAMSPTIIEMQPWRGLPLAFGAHDLIASRMSDAMVMA